MFKLQQKVLKFSGTCVSWRLPKIRAETRKVDILRKSVFLNRNYLNKSLTPFLLIDYFIINPY